MINRRLYILGISFLVCTVIVGCSGIVTKKYSEQTIKNSEASLVLKNGKIYSMVDETKVYEAVAVNDDKIVFLGSNEEVERYISEVTNVIDLKGNTVIPGFIATEINVTQNVLERLYSVYLNDCTTNEEYVQEITQYVKKRKAPEIIVGGGWKDQYYQDDLGPKKEDLDKITEDIPIVLRSYDGHSVWLNSKALSLAGITKETKDIEGGEIERYEDGTPSGTLRNAAITLIHPLYLYSPYTGDQYEYAYSQFQNYMNSIGVTTVQTMQNLYLDNKLELESIKQMKNQFNLHIRQSNVSHVITSGDTETTIKNLMDSNEKYNTDYFKLNTVHITLDGAYVSNTCYMSTPYKNSDYSGEKLWDDEELYSVLMMANTYGINVQINAEGSGAVKQALQVIEKVKEENKSYHTKVTIADINFLDKKDILMMDELGVNASFNYYPLEYQMEKRDEVFGRDSEIAVNVLDDMYKLGMNVAFTIQNSELKQEPLLLIEDIVTTYDDVSVFNIVSSLTKMAAYEIDMEDMVGTLEVNKKADLLVLNSNIFETNKEEISDTQIIYTISNGEVIY